jgi:hypothetical protein
LASSIDRLSIGHGLFSFVDRFPFFRAYGEQFVSIPRDLRVDIPGHGPGKVNAALQLGGTALAIQTIRALTDVPILP